MSDTYRTVRFEGDLDINRYPEIHEHLVKYPGAETSPILVDLSKVEFADSTCLAELLFLARRCATARVLLAVATASPQVLNIITHSNLAQQFRMFRDLESARSALAARELA